MASPVKSPLIIGHRGASAVAPENTLVAFERGFADGADGIELDVRLSRDGVPVIIHDANLKRTGGSAQAIAELTAAELARADVGSWFNRAHAALARPEYAKQFVPTLEQVFATLETLRAKDRIIYVELKIDRGDEFRGLVEAVADLISQRGLTKQVVVISFQLAAVALIKELNSSIRTGALFEPKRSAHRVVRSSPMISAALECGANEILFHRLLATRRIVETALEADLVPVVWTVDDPKWIERAHNRGIHALITNDPAMMIK